MSITITLADLFANPSEEDLRGARDAMSKIILPWEKDSSHPARYIRRVATGLHNVGSIGVEGVVAVVDPWVGGFNKNAHEPEYLGWKIGLPGTGDQGIIALGSDNVPHRVQGRDALWATAFRCAEEALARAAADKGYTVMPSYIPEPTKK